MVKHTFSTAIHPPHGGAGSFAFHYTSLNELLSQWKYLSLFRGTQSSWEIALQRRMKGGIVAEDVKCATRVIPACDVNW